MPKRKLNVVYVIEWLMWLGGLFDGWFVLLNGLCGWVVYLIGWFVLLNGLFDRVVYVVVSFV